jgi:hypothetical protein
MALDLPMRVTFSHLPGVYYWNAITPWIREFLELTIESSKKWPIVPIPWTPGRRACGVAPIDTYSGPPEYSSKAYAFAVNGRKSFECIVDDIPGSDGSLHLGVRAPDGGQLEPGTSVALSYMYNTGDLAKLPKKYSYVRDGRLVNTHVRMSLLDYQPTIPTIRALVTPSAAKTITAQAVERLPAYLH